MLRVLSLNVAHGRSNGVHQLLQRPGHRERTLASIGALFERERPDIVALQEADGPSFWSGRFCHVESLARRGDFAYSAHGRHVERTWLCYGTGLLSRLELHDPQTHTFARTLPTPTKGFTLATVRALDAEIDVVSAHLDFLRATVRARQVAQMIDVLARRRRPLVVMGDFNADWHHRRSAVRELAEALELTAHEPNAPTHTFKKLPLRLDWILTSPQLAFERHVVLRDVVSDHLPVLADLRLR
jgi:endonuclease/exonuclease/phosphatase family metal-dependent hydrolase